jgi:hypothetical protein
MEYKQSRDLDQGIHLFNYPQSTLITSLIYLLQAVVQKNCPDGINSRGITLKGFNFLISLQSPQNYLSNVL